MENKPKKNNASATESCAADDGLSLHPPSLPPQNPSPSSSSPRILLPNQVVNADVKESTIQDQNIAGIVIKAQVAQVVREAGSNASIDNRTPEAVTVKQEREENKESIVQTERDKKDLEVEIWIRQNVFLYAIFKRLFSEVFPDVEPQQKDSFSCSELVQKIKAKAENVDVDIFEKIENTCRELSHLPNAVDEEMRWKKIETIFQEVTEKLCIKQEVKNSFSVTIAKKKPVNWVDIVYLEHCFKGDPLGQHVLVNIPTWHALSYQSTDEQRKHDIALPHPYVPRPKVEDQVKSLMEDQKTRIVNVYGNIGCGKTTIIEQNLQGEKDLIPIQFPDTLPTEQPDIVVERFAEKILEKYGQVPSQKHLSNNLTRPTYHLISFLETLGGKKLIFDPIDDVLRTELISKYFIENLNKLLNNSVSFVLVSSLNKSDILKESVLNSKNVSVPLFAQEESILFLERFFKDFESTEILDGFDYTTIARYSGNNPKILKILAKAVMKKIKRMGSISSEYFFYMLKSKNDSLITEKVELDNVIRGRIKGLDQKTKVILEAIALFPETFHFKDLRKLLDMDVVYQSLFSDDTETKPAEEEQKMAILRSHAEQHCGELAASLKGKEEGALIDICLNSIEELIGLLMIENVGNGKYRLDPYVRQIAFEVFGDNPFKYLKVHFGSIQLKKLLEGDAIDLAFYRSSVRQLVVMMLQMFPENGPSKILNLSIDEIWQILTGCCEPISSLILRFGSRQVFYSPQEYFSLSYILTKAMKKGMESDSEQGNLTCYLGC